MPSATDRNKIRSVAIFFAYSLRGNIPLNETRIMKLAYLAELRAIEAWGRRLTSARWRNYYYGPYSREIAEALQETSPELNMERRITPKGRWGKFYLPALPDVSLDISEEEFQLLEDVAKDWAYVDNDTLVQTTKGSPPFTWTREEDDIPFDTYQEFIKRFRDAQQPEFGQEADTLDSEKEIHAFIQSL